MLIHNLVATGSLSYNGVNISYVTGSQASLDGLNQFSSSVNLTTGSLNSTTGSLNTATGSLFTASGSFSTRVSSIEGNYATTGSNVFLGAQTVCANITSTGTIIAQTLNVQQVTSSIVYSSGSNIFGCQLTDVQQMTGSVRITGSLNVAGNTCVTSICSPSIVGGTVSGTTIYGSTVACSPIGCFTTSCASAFIGGTVSGTTIYGSTAICGGVICGGATTLTGALNGTSATFSGQVNAGGNPGYAGRAINGIANNTDYAMTLRQDNTNGSGLQLFINQNAWAFGSTPLVVSNLTGNLFTLNYLGAATFSNSVTAGDTILVPSDVSGAGGYKINYTSLSASSRSWKIANDLAAYGDFWIGQSTTQTGSSYTPRLYINASGNVGIGTSSPNFKLHISAGDTTSITQPTAGTYAAYIQQNTSGTTGGLYIQDGASNNGNALFIADNNGVGRVVVDSNGNVGIGTTSINSEMLTINQTAGNWSALLVNTTGVTTGQSYGLTIQAGTNSSDRSFGVYNQGGSTEYFRIRGDGYMQSQPTYNNTTANAANVSISSSGYFERSTSSIKYKKDVIDYDKGLTEVLQMRPVYYKGKGENDGNKQFAGLIAEDIDALGLNEFVTYAEDGSPDALAYQNMVALLTKAIQEQQCKINILESCLGIN